MKKPVFLGAATAIVTPFCDGKLDQPAFERLLRQQLEAGIRAIVVTGTTGEAATLSQEEKETLWRLAVRISDGAAVIIAGVGTNNTAQSVVLAKAAEHCGADALLAVTPYYNKATQEGLYRHYFTIAEATDLPLIAYNVPSRTGVALEPETCQRLAQHERIAGVKEAGGDLTKLAKIRRLCGDELPIWCGNDDQIVPAMALGACGVISVLSNIRPRMVKALCDHALAGRFAEAAALQLNALPLIDALFSEVNPIPVKAALAAEGLCRDELRLPLTPLSDEKRPALQAALSNCPDHNGAVSIVGAEIKNK